MPSTCLGLESFGFTRDNNGDLWNHVFKGDVVIEDNVWIGACTAVDRGMFDTTKIQEGTKIQNLVHVGHETNIGESTLINQMTSLAGNVNIGNKVRIHPAVSVAGYVEIGDRSEVGTNSTVLENVPMNTKVAGVPAKKIGEVSLQTTTFDVDAKNKMGDEE
jgi:UDP-3-O-[3-hydroxymyristoyl] glucosamine N-acyltransferase